MLALNIYSILGLINFEQSHFFPSPKTACVRACVREQLQVSVRTSPFNVANTFYEAFLDLNCNCSGRRIGPRQGLGYISEEVLPPPWAGGYKK